MHSAGGTLSSRAHKGLNELEIVGLAETGATKINVAQASGCVPNQATQTATSACLAGFFRDGQGVCVPVGTCQANHTWDNAARVCRPSPTAPRAPCKTAAR